MSGEELTGHIRGMVVSNKDGRILSSMGLGSDERITALIESAEWLAQGKEKRLVPLLLDQTKLALFVQEFSDGYLVLISELPTDTVLRFLLNVDFAYDILDHILSDPYDGMVIVNAEEKLVFVSPVHEKFFGLTEGGGIGSHVREVIENTRLHHVVRTGVAEIGQIHRMNGSERIVSRHPILRKGQIAGAVGRVMFKGPQQVEAMARRIKSLEQQLASFKQASKPRAVEEDCLEAIVGQSAAIQSIRQQIRKIAPIDIPVLIEGESGTGKELVAQALHLMSSRQDGRLVTVNAAALPESLVESELFGYEAGSFTGADRRGRPGKFELADKGTMFLDEIGDMPLEVQTKLLRVLQDRMVERIGGAEKPKRVDFRLCSATNRDLQQYVDQGRFRLDLYYRISPVRITLPALRDRLEDIPLLVAHFVNELSRHYNRPLPEIDANVHDFLMEQSWPGNVRQLKHEIERAFVFSENGRLRVSNFVQEYSFSSRPIPSAKSVISVPPQTTEGTLQERLELVENQVIEEALAQFKGNKKKVAEHLGISRSYLYKKLEGGANA